MADSVVTGHGHAKRIIFITMTDEELIEKKSLPRSFVQPIFIDFSRRRRRVAGEGLQPSIQLSPGRLRCERTAIFEAEGSGTLAMPSSPFDPCSPYGAARQVIASHGQPEGMVHFDRLTPLLSD